MCGDDVKVATADWRRIQNDRKRSRGREKGSPERLIEAIDWRDGSALMTFAHQFGFHLIHGWGNESARAPHPLYGPLGKLFDVIDIHGGSCPLFLSHFVSLISIYVYIYIYIYIYLSRERERKRERNRAVMFDKSASYFRCRSALFLFFARLFLIFKCDESITSDQDEFATTIPSYRNLWHTIFLFWFVINNT